MSTVISASTTPNTAYNVVPDTSGSLAFATGASPTVAMTISSAQVVTFVNPPVGVDAFPSGTTMMFVQTAAPTGWTKSTAHDNKALRVVSGTAGTGGSVAFTTAFASQTPAGSVSTSTTTGNTTAGGSVSVSGTVGGTTLTTAQIPSHNHQTVTNAASGSVTWGSGGTIAGLNASAYASGTGAYSSSTGGGGSHDHSFSGSGSFTGTAHNHTASSTSSFTGTAINLAVQYVDVIIATKN